MCSASHRDVVQCISSNFILLYNLSNHCCVCVCVFVPVFSVLLIPTIMIINMSLVYYYDCLAIEGDHVILKESLTGLLSLLLEAIKCDSDCDTIR